MKKITLMTVLAIGAMFFTSCVKIDYKSFVGTWGVEKIEYYNVDYAGDPIAASMVSYNYDPNSSDNGIQLVFREDQTGEMRDSAIDTIFLWNSETEAYDIPLPCPDTVVVTPFTYSYDKSDRSLYMNMTYDSTLRTYRMHVRDFKEDSFTYENEYDKDYMEKAYLKRITKASSKSTDRQTVKHPHKPGSFLGGR